VQQKSKCRRVRFHSINELAYYKLAVLSFKR
jgi:hypothetical protein